MGTGLFLLDMDGVLHQFGHGVPGATEFLQFLLDDNMPFTVITNECRYTAAGLAEKLEGILDVKIPTSQIYTAANSVRDYLARGVRRGWSGNVFAIGEEGLVANVREALQDTPGCRVITPRDPPEADLYCDIVVIGTVQTGGPNDSWCSAERASDFLRKGAKLLYSNPDSYEVTRQGDFKFGCPMPVVNLLMSVTNCTAYNLGKPNPFMMRMAHKQLVETLYAGLSKAQRSFVQADIALQDVLFVGDSLGTDVRTAIENEIDSALVMSGTTNEEMLARSALRPNFVFDNIAGLHQSLLDGTLSKTHAKRPNFGRDPLPAREQPDEVQSD
mmetsp:Transcript_54075/g.143974  ORF Transcript_54075/g.143974 Transcript_54075/m.143974 type:complete len:329 (+) Transcript_54075:190-1176(+)